MIQSGLKCNDDITTHPAAVSLAKFSHNQFEQGKLITYETVGYYSYS